MLMSISMSPKNPLVAWVDTNLYGVHLKSFDVRPSGMKDKAIIKFLINKVDTYSHLTLLLSTLEDTMTLEEPTDPNAVACYLEMTCNIKFEANESAILMKVTLLMAVALKAQDCIIVSYHALELPAKKSGHPYVTDMLVTNLPKVTSDEGSIATILKNEAILMIIECKKAVSQSFSMIDPSDIEILIYCRYLLEIYKQGDIIGIVTDSINWHCM